MQCVMTNVVSSDLDPMIEFFASGDVDINNVHLLLNEIDSLCTRWGMTSKINIIE